MAETLSRSSLSTAVAGQPVNLERAVTPQTRLGGHLMQGHVDGVGHIVTRKPGEHWEVVRIALPPELARYVVEKGSIAVDGVSLTVSAVSPVPGPTPIRTPTPGSRSASSRPPSARPRSVRAPRGSPSTWRST